MIDAIILPRTGKQIKEGILDDLRLHKKSAKCTWVDISDGTRQEFADLGKLFNLHPLTLEDLYRRNVRTKLELFREYTFIIIYGLKRERKLSFYELNFIIGKNFVISSHRGKLELYEHLKEDKEKLEKIMKAGPDFVLHRLMDLVVDNMIPLFEVIDKEVDDIERKIVETPTNELLNKILSMRTELIDVRRLIPSQREVIASLVRGESEFLAKSTTAYFRDLLDNTIRINEKLDVSRESLRTILDIYVLSTGNRTNDVIKMLTIIATIMLPLSVITGLYGMNVTLPFAENHNTFFGILVFMAIISLGMIYYFIRKGWL